MAVVTLHAKSTIVSVILVVATDAAGRLGQFGVYRILMAIDTLEVLVFPVQFEFGFVVIEIPILPVARVVARLAAFS